MKKHTARIVATLIILVLAFIVPATLQLGSYRLETTSHSDWDDEPATGVSGDFGMSGHDAEVLSSEDAVGIEGAILYDDVYVMYDGTTVLVTEETLRGLYREDCAPWMECTVEEVPCVDVASVREYAQEYLGSTLLGFQEREIARNKAGEFSYIDANFGPDIEDMVGNIVSLLTARVWRYSELVCEVDEPVQEGTGVEGLKVVKVKKQEIPGTDGSFADKYIELDDSQQHIYAWEKGQVVADYEVSGFYDEYAVYGVFTVREKAKNAWSPIAEKWMPWWMAFYYDPKQEAWYGIHELVYWTDDAGVYHEESSDSIGQKKSGGCVRLDRGEAEELYKWAEEGDYVLIHP